MSSGANRERRLVTTSFGACGALLFGLLSQTPARAAWDFVPDLVVGARTSENPRLDPDTLATATTTATNTVLEAGATLATFNERSFLSVEPTVVSYQYSDERDSDLESTDWSLDALGEYQWQTVTAGFNASLARERLLDAELIGVDLDGNPDTVDPDTGDTGRLAFISEDRERVWANPYLSFRVSDRNTVRLDATRYDYTYSGGDRGFRTGFGNTRFAASINRNVDARNLVSATVAAETYDADGTQNTTDTVTIEGAFTRPLTELWTLNFAAGVLRSEFRFLINNQLIDNATTDYTMRFGLRKRAARSRMNIDFTRAVYPSGSGFSAVRRELRMYYDRALTERVNARFGVRLNETTSLGDVNLDDNRDYTRAEIGFEWAVKPVLFLQAGYDYTAQKFAQDVVQQKTNSGSLYVGLNYRGLSRQQR